MLKVGIVIDDWKLPVFKRHLDGARQQYTQAPGITDKTITLMAMTNSVIELEAVVQAANNEAGKHGR